MHDKELERGQIWLHDGGNYTYFVLAPTTNEEHPEFTIAEIYNGTFNQFLKGYKKINLPSDVILKSNYSMSDVMVMNLLREKMQYDEQIRTERMRSATNQTYALQQMGNQVATWAKFHGVTMADRRELHRQLVGHGVEARPNPFEEAVEVVREVEEPAAAGTEWHSAPVYEWRDITVTSTNW